jgi:phosphatidylglycerophosphatase A
MKRPVAILIASVFYSGYCPVASGTVASGLALAVYLLIWPLNSPNSGNIYFYLAMLTALSGIGIWSATHAELYFNEKDSHKIVIDEFTGFFYAMLLLPLTAFNLIAAFLLFRLLDVVKPFPIRRSQGLPGGVGVMCDDILAGVYTCGILHLVSLLIR